MFRNLTPRDPLPTSSPRIVIASSGLGHVARGVESWASDLAEVLYERKLDVVLCKGDGKAEHAYEHVISCYQRESDRNASLHRLLPRSVAWRLGLGSRYGLEQMTFAWNLIKRLRKLRADILHVQDPLVALLVQRANQLGLVRTRVILAHGTEESLQFQSKIVHLQHLAPWHLDESRQLGCWKSSWTAIPNFVDTDRFTPGNRLGLRTELDISVDSIVLLCVAAIKRGHKRVDYLIHEVARLVAMRPDLPIVLVIAGGWDTETNEVVEEGKRLLGNRVRFLIRFPRSRMPELYQMANLFVMSSLKEMMPMALLEAMASGLPSVVSNHPVFAWMVGSGGRNVEMCHAGGLAAALLPLLSCKKHLKVMGAAARAHCLGRFAKESVVEQILMQYESVSGKRFDVGQGAGVPLELHKISTGALQCV